MRRFVLDLDGAPPGIKYDGMLSIALELSVVSLIAAAIGPSLRPVRCFAPVVGYLLFCILVTVN